MLQIGQNEFGHQGLLHEEELDNGNRIQNRHRVLNASLGRFLQRDPYQQNQIIPTAGDGYQDGMNLRQYVESNPIIHTDSFGLWKWKNGKRQGQNRAIMIADDEDTIETAAQFALLDPSQPEKWLYNESTSTWVKMGDMIASGCSYSIPNVVYITKGDTSGYVFAKGGFTWINMWISMEISNYKNEMVLRGYNIVYDSSATLNDIEHYLGQKDIYGWFFAGHGQGGFLVTSGDGMGVFAGQAKNRLHHRLGFVTLYACEAGQDSGWIGLISRYGILRATTSAVYVAFTNWNDVPSVPYPED